MIRQHEASEEAPVLNKQKIQRDDTVIKGIKIAEIQQNNVVNNYNSIYTDILKGVVNPHMNMKVIEELQRMHFNSLQTMVISHENLLNIKLQVDSLLSIKLDEQKTNSSDN